MPLIIGASHGRWPAEPVSFEVVVSGSPRGQSNHRLRYPGGGQCSGGNRNVAATITGTTGHGRKRSGHHASGTQSRSLPVPWPPAALDGHDHRNRRGGYSAGACSAIPPILPIPVSRVPTAPLRTRPEVWFPELPEALWANGTARGIGGNPNDYAGTDSADFQTLLLTISKTFKDGTLDDSDTSETGPGDSTGANVQIGEQVYL